MPWRAGNVALFYSMIRFLSSRGLSGLLVGLVMPIAVCAQSVTEVRLYPLTEQPANSPLSPPEQITYRTWGLDDRSFNRLVENVSVPTVTVYQPAKNLHRGVAVVICPGGGYRFVVVDREGAALARYFQQQGLTAVVLKYRLPNPAVTGDALPLSQQDAFAAMQYVRAHATEWGLDAHRIGIVGSSAGGHLAGSVAILGEAGAGTRPDFAVLLYPAIFMDGPNAHQGSREKLLGLSPTPERVAAFSLERQARSGLPPFFIAHAKDDRVVTVENSRAFAEALRAANVPVELHLFEEGGHGFSLGKGAESSQWPGQFLKWLDALP